MNEETAEREENEEKIYNRYVIKKKLYKRYNKHKKKKTLTDGVRQKNIILKTK